MGAISEEPSDELMKLVATALYPLSASLWGDRAIGYHGAPIVCDHYIFVIRDADMTVADNSLQSHGFTACSWSYGSVALSFYEQDDIRKRIYSNVVKSFYNLDRNSLRYFFPGDYKSETKVVLLPASYAHIDFDNDGLETMPKQYHNIINPDAKLLVRSFVQTLLSEPTRGMWTSTLRVWAIPYAYGELMLSDDILDRCNDEDAQTWFNHAIQRSTGGIDRVTQTKRLGRKVGRMDG